MIIELRTQHTPASSNEVAAPNFDPRPIVESEVLIFTPYKRITSSRIILRPRGSGAGAVRGRRAR